jgi:hypothetical protein
VKWLIASLITITILSLFLEAYFLMDEVYGLLELSSPFSIYWLDMYSVPLRLSFTCLVIPISIGITLFTLATRKISKLMSFAVILFLLILTNLIGFFALPGGILRSSEQQDGLKFERHTYYIAYSEADVGLAHPSLELYECDAWGFLCQKIFHFKRKTIDWSEEHQWQSTLIPDAAAHTVTLQINGETVYVHPVK